MKQRLVIDIFRLYLLGLGFLVLGFGSCGDQVAGGASETGNNELAKIKIETYDAPPPSTVEHIYLTVKEVSIHSSEYGWQILAEPDTTIDFLELVSGKTAVLADTFVKPGSYNQIRILLADSNELVIDKQVHTLTVPYGDSSGVNLQVSFRLAKAGSIRVFVDFDASTSINWEASEYRLEPSFKAFTDDSVGRVSGTIVDVKGDPVVNALVEAISCKGDTISTLTAVDGTYQLRVPSGTYKIKAMVKKGSSVASSYRGGIKVDIGAEVTGINFNITVKMGG